MNVFKFQKFEQEHALKFPKLVIADQTSSDQTEKLVDTTVNFKWIAIFPVSNKITFTNIEMKFKIPVETPKPPQP